MTATTPKNRRNRKAQDMAEATRPLAKVGRWGTMRSEERER